MQDNSSNVMNGSSAKRSRASAATTAEKSVKNTAEDHQNYFEILALILQTFNESQNIDTPHPRDYSTSGRIKAALKKSQSSTDLSTRLSDFAPINSDFSKSPVASTENENRGREREKREVEFLDDD